VVVVVVEEEDSIEPPSVTIKSGETPKSGFLGPGTRLI